MSIDWAADPMLLLIFVFACHRVTRLITADEFPPVERLRQTVLDRTRDDSALAYLITCPWCVGWWLSLVGVIIASTGTWWLWAGVPLAVSSAIGLLAARE